MKETIESEVTTPQKSGFKLGRTLAWAALAAILTLVYIQLSKAQQVTIKIGEPAPDFVLTSFEGESYDTVALRGKVIVVNFWASWCIPCEVEAKELQEAWEYYEDRGDVLFLGVDWTDTTNEAHAYLEKFGISYPNGPDLGTRISQAYRTTGVPETYIIDRDGTLADVKIGPFQSLDEILDMVDWVLNP